MPFEEPAVAVYAGAQTCAPKTLAVLWGSTFSSERRDSSPLERASAILCSAVEYLLEEQVHRQCGGWEATRHAVELLCGAARLVQGEERRRRPQQITAHWLRNADRRRAALDDSA